MEAAINLPQSDFRRLIDRSGRSSSPDSVQYLHSRIFLIVNNIYLLYPGAQDNVDRLLALPMIVKLIDNFIDGLLNGDSSSAFKKNAAKSVDFCNRGNCEYEGRNFTQAAYLYTMAIVYAPNVSEDDDVPKDNVPEELSLAFGNRSAVFFELGLHVACLEDIEHALATGCPRSKLSKLLLRKIECLIALERLGAAKKVLEYFVATMGTEPSDDYERVLKIGLQLLEIKEDDDNQKQDNQMSLPFTNSMLPAIDYLHRGGRYEPTADLSPLSAKLEPRFSSAKGRHLVAKVDIEPGDILMVESPYTSVLKMVNEFHYCHHCCRKLESDLKAKSGDDQGQLCINGALVPCTECTCVLYCSTVCRTESWRLYHQFECALQPVLFKLANSANCSLALRILLTTGLDVAQQVATRNQVDDKFKESIPVLGNDPPYYEHVYRLVHHRDKIDDIDAFVNTAALLVQLTKKCGFVRTPEQAKLAGTIMLRHLLQLRVNTHLIFDWKRAEVGSYSEFDFASGIYPYTSSLLNHSCDPNTVRAWHHGTLMIQRATRRITAGTEVTATYGPTFYGGGRNERQTLLESQSFTCDCSRCVLEERDGLRGRYFPIGCQKCGSPLIRKFSPSKNFFCSSSTCSANKKKKSLKLSLIDAKQLYARIESLLATVDHLSKSYQQLGETGKFCIEKQLAEWESQLSELSSVKGMRNYFILYWVYNQLAGAYEHSGTADKAIQCLERFCEIEEYNCGITPSLYLHIDRLANLYSQAGDSQQQEEHKSLHQRVLKRAIELLRLFSLANLQQDKGPDLMVDGASFLWDKHQQLVKTLDGLKLCDDSIR